MKIPAIYIMASARNGTLYTGVTSNLPQRVYIHKFYSSKKSFTKKYSCTLLVYYEVYYDMFDAITREKQIKGGSRKTKLALIETMNPTWKDLYDDLF